MSEIKLTKSQVNKAGILLTKETTPEEKRDNALQIVSAWRRAHNYPLQVFTTTLEKYAKEISPEAITVQRLKRIPSIIKKLQRTYPGQKGTIKLTRMQDIAGCRSILPTLKDVQLLQQKYEKSRLRHKKIKENNYLLEPKEDGYRSLHLIYAFQSEKNKQEYNDKLIEIQIRTQLQHLWATAVETTGFFIGQALKLSEGEEDWKEFFQLVSIAFARKEETPELKQNKKLYQLIREKEKKLFAITKMKKWNESIRLFEEMSSKKEKEYFVLELDTIQEKTTISSFTKQEEEKAIELYAKIEKKIYGRKEYDVVLVGAKNITTLKEAYLNYFADTKEFIKEIKKIVDEKN